MTIVIKPHTRINLKRIKDVNVSQEIMKILKENVGSKKSDIFCSSIFTDTSPRATETKGKK